MSCKTFNPAVEFHNACKYTLQHIYQYISSTNKLYYAENHVGTNYSNIKWLVSILEKDEEKEIDVSVYIKDIRYSINKFEEMGSLIDQSYVEDAKRFREFFNKY